MTGDLKQEQIRTSTPYIGRSPIDHHTHLAHVVHMGCHFLNQEKRFRRDREMHYTQEVSSLEVQLERYW